MSTPTRQLPNAIVEETILPRPGSLSPVSGVIATASPELKSSNLHPSTNTVLLLLGILGATLGLRLATMPSFIESRDGLFFVRSLERYSVYEMRPHWPGYPVYVLFGKFFNLLVADRTLALHLLSLVAACLSLWPLARLAGEWRRASLPAGLAARQVEAEVRRATLMAAGLWAFVPLSWLGAGEIFSDALALYLSLLMLWCCWLALAGGPRARLYLLVGGSLGGLMLGVRLSYLTLLLPLFFVGWRQWRANQHASRWLPLWLLLSIALPVAFWLGGQVAVEGGRFFQATERHLTGHYTEWGGSVTTDRQILTRPFRLAETGLVYGLGAWWPGTPLERLPLTFFWLGLVGLGSWRLLRKATNHSPTWLAVLWAGPYLAWIGFGNDVDLARYYLPLVALACLVAGNGLPQGWRGWPVLVGGLVALLVVSGPLGFEHRDSLPISHRLTNYINANLDPAQATLIVTDEIPYLIFFTQENAPAIPSVRVSEAELTARTARFEAEGRTVYATWTPAQVPQGWQPVARLCRSRFMESRGPLEVWLYRHTPGPAPNVNAFDAPPLSCS